MDRAEPIREMRLGYIQCVLALAIILVAFWVSDVAPSQPAGSRVVEEQPWAGPLRAADAALARMDVPAAERAWHEAYVHALASRRWDGLVAVGEASVRIGEAAGQRAVADAKARAAYLTALFRARQQRAVGGVLQAARGFADLGDREVVEQCLRVAGDLAAEAGDADAGARVRALAGELAAR